MKKIAIITILLLIGVPGVVSANTGVFFGVGNQVIPIKNHDIQLLREKVNVRLTVEKGNGKIGVPETPWANVTAKFHLKNTTNKKVSLQVGFPFLDLQGFGNEKYVLKNLNFKVLSNGKTIKTALKKGLIEKKFDPEGLFKKVFAWKENFTPNETKTVVVSYKLLLSVASANSNMRDFKAEGRKYYELDDLFPAIIYNFGYITKTAYTWKGPVEEAIFEVDSNAFIKQLGQTDFAAWFGLGDLHLSRIVFLENIFPRGYQKQENTYSWKFKDKVPEEGLSVNFLALFIPSHQNELLPFLKANTQKLKEVTPEEYRAVLRQYYLLLASNSQPVDSFLIDYFKDVQITKEKGDFLFEDDRKNVMEISERFDKLTKE